MYAWYDAKTDKIFECTHRRNVPGRYLVVTRLDQVRFLRISYDVFYCIYLGKI